MSQNNCKKLPIVEMCDCFSRNQSNKSKMLGRELLTSAEQSDILMKIEEYATKSPSATARRSGGHGRARFTDRYGERSLRLFGRTLTPN